LKRAPFGSERPGELALAFTDDKIVGATKTQYNQ
jgi:hypothetical protein